MTEENEYWQLSFLWMNAHPTPGPGLVMPFIMQPALPTTLQVQQYNTGVSGLKGLTVHIHPREVWGSCRTRYDQEARLLKLCLIGSEYSPKMLFPDGDQTKSSKDEGVSKTPQILFLERDKWGLFEVLIVSERSVFSKCINWNLYPQLIVLGDRDFGRWCVNEDGA